MSVVRWNLKDTNYIWGLLEVNEFAKQNEVQHYLKLLRVTVADIWDEGYYYGGHSVASVLPEVEIENRARIATDNLLEKILAKDNMYRAMQRVIKNKGSHSFDGIKTDELHDYCKMHWATMKSKLLDGTSSHKG